MSTATLDQAFRALEIMKEHGLGTKETQALLERLPALAEAARKEQGRMAPVSHFRRLLGIDPPIQFFKETIEINSGEPLRVLLDRYGLESSADIRYNYWLDRYRVQFCSRVYQCAIFPFHRDIEEAAVWRTIVEADLERPWERAQIYHLVHFLPIYRQHKLISSVRALDCDLYKPDCVGVHRPVLYDRPGGLGQALGFVHSTDRSQVKVYLAVRSVQ